MPGEPRLGDRVRLSGRGLDVFPRARTRNRWRGRLGTVRGFSREGYPRVLWDGQKHAETWRPEFLEPTAGARDVR